MTSVFNDPVRWAAEMVGTSKAYGFAVLLQGLGALLIWQSFTAPLVDKLPVILFALVIPFFYIYALRQAVVRRL